MSPDEVTCKFVGVSSRAAAAGAYFGASPKRPGPSGASEAARRVASRRNSGSGGAELAATSTRCCLAAGSFGALKDAVCPVAVTLSLLP